MQLDYRAHDHKKIISWEREMKHIATCRSQSPRENYSLLIIGVSNCDEDGGGVDGDPSGGTSPCRKGAGTGLCPPKLGFRCDGGGGTFLGNSRLSLGFSVRGE